MMKPWKYHDPISGNEIEISVSQLYTTLRINNRCYYLRAENGAFDVTSTDLTVKPSLSPSPIRGRRLRSSYSQPA